MKKYYESKKGVIMFYLIIALLAIICTYRFKFLANKENVSNNSIILENALVNK